MRLTSWSHTLRGCVDWNQNQVMRLLEQDSHTLRGCVDWNLIFFYWFILEHPSHPSWVCGLKLLINGLVTVKLQSHPSWVCGLKPLDSAKLIKILLSHPSWVCGLKLISVDFVQKSVCHTLRGCVDWNSWGNQSKLVCSSHTLRGCVDWNPLGNAKGTPSVESHPSWVCGLKHFINDCVDRLQDVTPFVGVWIETFY